MMEAYRVRKNFQWDGWVYAPKGPSGECKCGCDSVENSPCTGRVGTGCVCHDTACHCDCGIKEAQYGGDVWMVIDGHPRKENILAYHFATYDASLPSVDQLQEDPEMQKLLKPYIPVYEKKQKARA